MLFPFPGGEIAEEIKNGVMLQVPKLARIEERAAAHRAVLEPDVRLFEIDHANHTTVTTRALNAIDSIESVPNVAISSIDRI